MPLLAIKNQPYFFQGRPTECFACDEREYSMPVIPGDPVEMQFQQTPCAPSIICDGDFSALTETQEVICDTEFNDLSAEELVNGSFTGNANGWSLGTGWTYAANQVSKAPGLVGNLSQNLASGFTPNNAVYKVVFTVSNFVSGICIPAFSDGTLFYFGDPITSNGTKTQYIKVGAANQFLFRCNGLAGTAADFTIDTVSVRRIAACWDFGGDYLSGWGIDSSGFAQTTNYPNGTYDTCSQCHLIAANNLTANTSYNVVIEIEDGDGAVAFDIGGTLSIFYTLTGGAQTITFQTGSGAGTDFEVIPATLSKLKISSVSLIEVDSECWEYEADEWVNVVNSMCHVPGGTGSTLTNIPLVQPGYYQLKFTVENRTAGTFNAGIGTVLATNTSGFTQNKDYVVYLDTSAQSADQLRFFTSATFDGCFSNIELFLLRNDFIFKIVDMAEPPVEVTDISFLASYKDDFVTLKFKPDEVQTPHGDLEFGCYRVQTFDLCEVQYEEIITDGEFLNPKQIYWVETGGSFSGTATTVIANELVVDNSALTTVTNQVSINNHKTPAALVDSAAFYEDNPTQILEGAHNYRITFDITQNDDPTNIVVNVLGGYQRPNPAPFSSSPVGSYSVDISYDPLYNTNPITGTPGRFWFGMNINMTNSTRGTVKIDNVSVRRIEPFDVTYTSVPFKYAASFPCTKYIRAYCDSDNLDFKFESPYPATPSEKFYIGMRINIEAVNPGYPEETDDYLYSEGTRIRNYGQSQRTFTLQTCPIPEWCHDAIAKMRASQHFQIGEPLDTFTEYFCLAGDYVPAWDKNGKFKLASGKFDIQLKDKDTKFFRNS